MPNWVSKDGKMYPAKERIALTNKSDETIKNPSEEGSAFAGMEVKPGQQFIYEGPDRAAMFELMKDGGNRNHLGQHFKNDHDFLQRVRQLGYKDIKEYAKVMDWDEQKTEELFKEKASVVNTHDLPKKVAAINIAGGGVDTTGMGEDRMGGFGKEPAIA